MAHIEIRDGDGSEKYLKATGAGTSEEPFVPEHLETNSADILAAVEASQVALELLDNAVDGSEIQVDIVSGTVGLTGDLPDTADGDLAAMAAATGAIRTATEAIRTATEACRTALELLDNAISGTEMQVDIVSGTVSLTGSLPDTAGGDLAAMAAAVADIETATEACQVALETIDNAISGTEMQVDVVGALPAGDNNIGNVDVVSLPSLPAGNNNIGDVDVASLPALPAGDNNIGNVDVVTLPTPPSSIYHGVKTVTSAGTAEALASSQAIVSGVTIKALADNTGLVYVGGSSVDSTNGFELAAGEQVFIEVANLATIYVDAEVSAEGVSYLAA